MTVSPTGQGKVFLINICFGLVCILLFDFIYVVRKKHNIGKAITNILDAVYFLVVFFAVLYANIKFNFGAVRYYQFMGLLAGSVTGLFFSSVTRKVLEKIYQGFLKCVKFAIKLVYKPVMFLLRVVLSPLFFFEAKMISMGEKVSKRCKKLKIKRKKSAETVKKRIKMI